jgi:hypothetical protein
MKEINMLDELKALLVEVAKRPHWDSNAEDFCVDDYAGGNIDDAFYGGESVGEVMFARRLLKRFFGETVVDEDDE